MNIEYQKKLRDFPSRNAGSQNYTGTNQPISLEEIQLLEQHYNNSNTFPKALRELLFLAGNYCYVLDYGIWNTQEEIQNYVRENMTELNRTISRPFYAVDIYNQGDQFLFIYLDEDDDPKVYEGAYYNNSDFPDWIHPIAVRSLSDLINQRIQRTQQGRNPF
ncbi:SMI1/KNR4 family protein [Pedobacter aquatilis]|uniref:SMI1/KNR4 family protein n=1 Tax=Pedobacter aquatilis TaxID=351343 RepID=UPI00292ECEE3|nr:SMI1/KNR4 family protein [Pedobacter aquatilis]